MAVISREHFVTSISVGLMVLMFFMGYAIYITTSFAGLYYKICEQSYNQDGSIDCTNLGNYPDIQDSVQADGARWSQYYSIALTIPAAFTNTIMSAYGDIYGRKLNFFMATVGVSLFALVFVFSISFVQSPLYILTITAIPAGFSGFHLLFGGAAYQYLSDEVADKKQLTVCMTIMVCCWSLAYVVGEFIAGELLLYMDYSATIVVGIACILAAAVYCYFVIKDKAPKLQPGKKVSVIKSVQQLLIDVWKTYRKKRTGNRRLHLILCCIAYLPYVTIDQGMDSTVSLFVFNRPLNFTATMLTWYWSGTALGFLIGNLSSSFGFKALKFHDDLIILISFASAIARLVVLSFSTTLWLVIVSSVCGIISYVGYPAFQSSVAQLVEPHEAGKALAGIQLVANIAPLLASVVYNNLYAETVTIFPGLTFIFVSGLVILSSIIVFFIYVDTTRNAKKVQATIPSCDSKQEIAADASSIFERF